MVIRVGSGAIFNSMRATNQNFGPIYGVYERRTTIHIELNIFAKSLIDVSIFMGEKIGYMDFSSEKCRRCSHSSSASEIYLTGKRCSSNS